MGMVTPFGMDKGRILSALRTGESGIAEHRLDDTLDILIGRVPESDIPRHLGDMTIDYALESSRLAWADAGLGEHTFDPWRAVTVVGSSKGRLASILSRSVGKEQPFDISNFPGNTLGLAVAQEFGLRGAVLNYPAACATGTHCLIRAAQCLQQGEADIALAGSAEASGKALVMASFKNMGALSLEQIRPFDVRRKGFNPGEGSATFVLEREADARARGAKILARLVGWDQRSDAYHITSAEPSGEVVTYSINRSLQMAGWQPGEVEYINAHGTGTPLNDVVEGRAIRGSFGIDTPLVSSLKPYVGHMLGASSAVELALAILALQNNYVPGTPGLEQPDPDIPLNFVPTGGLNQAVKKFMKLSLGFGGHIGVLAIELP